MPSLHTTAAGNGQRPYRIADVGEEPSDEHLEWMRARGVDGLSIRLPRGTRRVFPLGWTEDLGRLRYLEIVTLRPVGAIPASIAGELEVLQVQGRLHAPFDLGQAPRLRHLTLAHDLVAGPLSTAPVLEHCGLDRVTKFSSRLLEGCATLRSVFITADRRAVDPVWDFHLQGESALERLTLMNVGVRSLEGVSAFPTLRELVVVPGEEAGLEQRLDLSPLAACSQLQRLILHRSGGLDNAQVLDDLPALETVTVAQGAVDHDVEEREWLRVL